MDVYGISTKTISTEVHIKYALKLALEPFENLCHGEFVVIDKNNKVKGCINWPRLVKAYCEGKYYIRDVAWYFQKIQIANKSSLTEEIIQEAAEKSRSLFIVSDNSNSKKLYSRNLVAEITLKNIIEFFLGKKYSEKNCPYPFKFEVKK